VLRVFRLLGRWAVAGRGYGVFAAGVLRLAVLGFVAVTTNLKNGVLARRDSGVVKNMIILIGCLR